MKISVVAWKGAFFFFIFLAVIFIWLLCVIYQPFEPRQPEYQGKKLTDWAEEIDYGVFFGRPTSTDQEQSDRAISAIRQIGTNALPVAIRLCAAKDSWPKRKLEEWIDQYNNEVIDHNLGLPKDQWRSQLPIHITSAGEKQYDGANIIWALGPVAKPIIPDLIRLLENQDQLHEYTITMVLGAGTNAIPPLLKLLDNTNQEVRLRAAIVLGYFFQLKTPITLDRRLLVAGSEDFRPQARAAVPVLLHYLENPNQNSLDRAHVIYSLGLIHENASIVVPTILRLMQSETNNWFNPGYIQLLGKFGTNAKPAVPVLVHVLESKSAWPPAKIAALAALQKISPEAAKPAVPVMLQILESKPQWPEDDYSGLKVSALFTLSKVDPQAAKPFVPRLLHILESESDWPGGYSPAQMFALVSLWRVDPIAAQPFFERWKPSQDWIVGELQRFDPEAAKAFMEKWKASQTNDLVHTPNPPLKQLKTSPSVTTNSASH
jgi:hypothetical protein